MAPDGGGAESSPQTVSTSPASLLSPKPGLGSSVLASLSILSTFLCAWSTQLRHFFVLLEAASQFHSGSQHLERGIALHGRLFGAWFALCLPAALSSPLGKLLDTEKESQQQQQRLLIKEKKTYQL